MKNENEKYYLGLDLGTNSIGWCVVNENNDIVTKKGKALWGVRMFDDAESAKSTRMYRCSKRVIERRRERIILLRNIFAEEISKVDNHFYERLDDSFFMSDDKINKNISNLFNDKDYKDNDFYKEYPTIYHLRKHLISSKEKEDIRLIYLAVHHIIKYRGNFLTQGGEFNISDDSSIRDTFESINSILTDYVLGNEDDESFFERIGQFDYEKLEEIMISSNSKNDKKKELFELFGLKEKKSFVNECIIPLLVGSDVKLNNISFVKDKDYEEVKISLKIEDLIEKIDEAKKNISDLSNLFDYILKLKDVRDHYYLIKLLGSNLYISDAMVSLYDEHAKDLSRLKKLFKNYPEIYNECFKKADEKINNYVKYIGMGKVGNKIVRLSHAKRDEFYVFLKKKFDEKKEESLQEDIMYFRSKIENDSLLLRQNSDQNGALPMQLNLAELKAILKNQSKYYEFLNVTDENCTNIEKIESLLTFKIPYYVGPLNNKSDRAWVVRTNEKIYPWNFDKVVNIDESAKKFIERMQNKCTYLKGIDDYCLPKNSIIFQNIIVFLT